MDDISPNKTKFLPESFSITIKEKRGKLEKHWITSGRCGEKEDWSPHIPGAQLINNDAIKVLH